MWQSFLERFEPPKDDERVRTCFNQLVVDDELADSGWMGKLLVILESNIVLIFILSLTFFDLTWMVYHYIVPPGSTQAGGELDDKQLDDYDNFTTEMHWKVTIIPYFVAFIFFCDVMGRYWLYTQCKTGADFFRNPFNVADFCLVCLDLGLASVDLVGLIQPEEELNCFEYKEPPRFTDDVALEMYRANAAYNLSLLWFCSNTHVINATDKSTDGCESYWMNSRTGASYRECESHLRDVAWITASDCVRNPLACGYYDDADFTSDEQCCACGGGGTIRPSPAPTSSPMPTTVAPTLCESPEGDFITFLLGFASGLRSLKALKLLKLMRALRAAKAARAMKSSANLSTFEAAKDGSLEGFKKALRRARNMEVEMWKRNKWGETPLHVAASAGSSQIVKFIINHASCADHGVDVRDSVEGRTPLWNACYDSRRDASELLLMSYADLSLMPLRGEYKGIPAQQIIKNKKWDDLVERAVRKRTAEQEARRLRGEAINRFENAALIRIQEAEAAKQAAIEREAEKVRKRCERAFALTHKCLVQLEKKSLQRVFKIWMPGVFTAEELDKIRRGLGEAAMRKARATRLAMLVTDPAILQERMLAKQRAIEEARVRRLADAESRKYKNKMRSGGMRDEWEAAAAAELAALEEAEAEAAAKAAAASGSSDAAPMRTRAKSTSREDKLGDDGSHSGSHGGEEWHAPSRPRTPAIPPEELELRRLRPFPRAGWPPPTIGWRGEKDQEKTYDALEKARAKEAEDALVQELKPPTDLVRGTPKAHGSGLQPPSDLVRGNPRAHTAPAGASRPGKAK